MVAGKVKVNKHESGHSGTETIYGRCLKETAEEKVRDARKDREMVNQLWISLLNIDLLFPVQSGPHLLPSVSCDKLYPPLR